IILSDGGEDAATLREFDLSTGGFVADGFTLPRSKQEVAWAGPDELLSARDWGPGTMTKSGYPFVVKSVKRGQKVSDAPEVFRRKPSHTRFSPSSLVDGDGRSVTVIERNVTFFETETYLLHNGKPVKLAL